MRDEYYILLTEEDPKRMEDGWRRVDMEEGTRVQNWQWDRMICTSHPNWE
jgi:hypothetical protein